MKRTKSALSLKNIAMSIKNSICLETQKTSKRQFIPLKQSRSTVSLKPKDRERVTDNEQPRMTKHQKQNRVFILQKQIAYLQKDVQASKASIRNYSKQLGQYEQTTIKIANIESAIREQRGVMEQYRNQAMMMREQLQSIEFNCEERIAQKQYYDELMQTYQNQYEDQSKEVMLILQTEEKNAVLVGQIKELQQKIDNSQKELDEWKKDTEFDLNQHKLKNNIKMVRMQLIGCEDQCDQFCNQNQLRKLRELYCLYFKNYAKKNGVSNQQAQNGIDIYICKQGLVQEFNEFIRQRLIYNKPKTELFDNYLQILAKMQNIFRKSTSEANKKLLNYFKGDVKQLHLQKDQKNLQVQRNEQQMKERVDKIDYLFNNESIAVIQYMREQNKNKYDIKDIKHKLKENKKEQRTRIQNIKETHRKIKELDRIIDKEAKATSNKYGYQQQILQLQQSISHSQNILQQLNRKLEKQQQQKDQIQTLISNAISKWKQRDDNKAKLKSLYQELQQAKQYNTFALTKNCQIQTKYGQIQTKNGQTQTHKLRKQDLEEQRSINGEHSNVKSTKKQQFQSNASSRHTKNPSLLSLNQSKSVLSLSNPYKKIMDRQLDCYQPIISDCQMILSRKLACRQIQTNQFTDQRQSRTLKEKTQNINMLKNKKDDWRLSSKQNVGLAIRNKSHSKLQSKYIPSGKNSIASSKNGRGTLAQSQRMSLSKLLISKFNR